MNLQGFDPKSTLREIIAATLANARSARRGVPSIKNVLAVLPKKMRDELLDDAAAVVEVLTPSARDRTPTPSGQMDGSSEDRAMEAYLRAEYEWNCGRGDSSISRHRYAMRAAIAAANAKVEASPA